MSSETKKDEGKESEVSCFTLDGVVAEMLIEVEDNEQSSPSKSKRKEDESKNESNSTDQEKSVERSEEASSMSKPDSAEDAPMKNKTGTDDESNKNSEESKGTEGADDAKTDKLVEDIKLVEEADKSGELGAETLSPVAEQVKRGRGRPKLKKSIADIIQYQPGDQKQNSNLRSRSSMKQNDSNKPSSAAKLKRGNKASPSQEKLDVPVKKLKKSSDDKTTRTQDSTEKRLSLRKTTLQSTPTNSKTKSTRVTNTPTSNRVKLPSKTSTQTPISSKVKPSLGKKGTPIPSKDNTLTAWNLKNDGSLNNFPEIKKQLRTAPHGALRSLCNLLYNSLHSKRAEAEKLKRKILAFKGFDFKKTSDMYEKHMNILNRMSDTSIGQIIRILNVKKKSLVGIMAFLMNPASYIPSEVIYCSVNPQALSMQPYVKLHQLNIKETATRTLSIDSSSTEDTIMSNKRKRFPSTKLKFFDVDYNTPKVIKKPVSKIKGKSVSKKPQVLSDKPTIIKNKLFVSELKRKSAIRAKSLKQVSLKQAAVKRAKERAFGNRQKATNKMPSSNLQIRRKALELALEIQGTKSPSPTRMLHSIEESDSLNLPDFEYESEIKEEVVTEDEDEIQTKSAAEVSDNADNILSKEVEENSAENASSEITLSSDEAKEADILIEPKERKRFYKTTAIPLKAYPSIRDNIMQANDGALQRLHIVLFGAPDKTSNLRGNLLSFGGFPFKEGSEEWRNKRFLLSLVSKNTLKEYLSLLSIKYHGDDQASLISKFMKFLSAPIENSPEDDEETRVDSETELAAPEDIASDEEVSSPKPPPKKSIPKKAPVESANKKVIKKPKIKKPTGKVPRNRKVLMDEAQVRRLEADLAREQRILERERRLHEEKLKKIVLPQFPVKVKPQSVASKIRVPLAENKSDAEVLSALLETVYQRRELKKAGANVSIPDKGSHTRLGELANVKFLVVTANYNDLDVLHHLIYMTEANKSKVRKNILDFAGFNFTENSSAYEDRMNFLKSLGYDISRRIAFLLGLCPYKTLIAQQDLNELIMYFLMAPCESKQVPIRHLPHSFFGNDMPVELAALMQKHGGDIDESSAERPTKTKSILHTSIPENRSKSPSYPISPHQRAKKTFKASFPLSERRGLTPSISTLPLKTPDKPSKPVLLATKPGSTPTSALPSIAAQQAIARSIAKATSSSGPNPQEFYIQQQTPDGQQKTFKLIKLPANHPLGTVMKTPQPVPSASTPPAPPKPATITPPLIGAPGLPPGLIVFKNNPSNPSLSSVMQTVPLTIGQSATAPMVVANIAGGNPVVVPSAAAVSPPVVLGTAAVNPLASPAVSKKLPAILPKSKRKEYDSDADSPDVDSPDEGDATIPVECKISDEEAEALEDESLPTDEELYICIEDIIHNCSSLDDITLRNVINQVTSKYPDFDLTSRHHYMKECVKKIIMGC